MSKKGKVGKLSYDEFLGPAEPKRIPADKAKKYKNHLIAFLDVLGIKALIDKHKKGDEYKAIDMIDEIRKIVETSAEIIKKPDDFYYLQISDSFVFICNPDDIVLLIKLLSVLQTRIITECHFQLRGAITIGDAIIREDGKFIIGPAYIQAYQLQENDAIYPRIIVDKSVINAVTEIEGGIDKYFKQDSDKEHFVDYIKVYSKYGSINKKDIIIKLRREGVFDYLKDKFSEFYEIENHNICQKLGWTTQYYKKIGVWEDA